jgi:hypothetical protein
VVSFSSRSQCELLPLAPSLVTIVAGSITASQIHDRVGQIRRQGLDLWLWWWSGGQWPNLVEVWWYKVEVWQPLLQRRCGGQIRRSSNLGCGTHGVRPTPPTEVHGGGGARPKSRPVRSRLWGFLLFFCFFVLINQGGQSACLHGRSLTVTFD